MLGVCAPDERNPRLTNAGGFRGRSRAGSGYGQTRPARRSLTIYFNDHLAGATGGVELARRQSDEDRAQALIPPRGLLGEGPRAAVRVGPHGLGYPVDRAKVALGWTAEKLGCLKPNGRLRGYSPLGRLLELEGLLAGIHTKQALWCTLLGTGNADPQRLEALLTRAEEQATIVERMHRQAAELAVGTHSTS
jgi:hypothetical protein